MFMLSDSAVPMPLLHDVNGSIIFLLHELISIIQWSSSQGRHLNHLVSVHLSSRLMRAHATVRLHRKLKVEESCWDFHLSIHPWQESLVKNGNEFCCKIKMYGLQVGMLIGMWGLKKLVDFPLKLPSWIKKKEIKILLKISGFGL